jgi:hypothetical protein
VVAPVRGFGVGEPKSLYQSPSGACGSAFTQSWRRRRSASEIRRSSTRSRRCCHKSRGRSENRIFGNSVFSKNGANQILSGFFFFRRLLFIQKTSIGGLDVFLGVPFGSNPSLRQSYESTADREVTFLGDSPDFGRQGRRDADTLAERPTSGSWGKRLGSGSHISLLYAACTTVVRCETQRQAPAANQQLVDLQFGCAWTLQL